MITARRLKLTGWTIPLGYAAAALVLGMTFPRLEHYYLPKLVSTMSAAAAMAFCSAVASGTISLTAIVFALAFVMVQFSATAYSPRLVLWVARNPVISHALGIFIATFLYALAMLGWIDRNATGTVPFISGWMVLGLLLASMGMFVALIEKIGALQVNSMLIFIGDQGRAAIDQLYSETTPTAIRDETGAHHELPVSQVLTYIGPPRVIQSFDVQTLLALAINHRAVIELAVTVGDTMIEMTPMLHVHGADRPLDENLLRKAIRLGDDRTFEQEPKYAIRLTVDIAIKALSPAINDPTTAVQALDQIEDLLLRLGSRQLGIGAFQDQGGQLRVLISFPTWDDYLRLALDEIQAYGADSVQVMRRMKALIAHLIAVLPGKRHSALLRWDQRLQGSIRRSFVDVEEQEAASIADRQGLGTGREGVDQS